MKHDVISLLLVVSGLFVIFDAVSSESQLKVIRQTHLFSTDDERHYNRKPVEPQTNATTTNAGREWKKIPTEKLSTACIRHNDLVCRPQFISLLTWRHPLNPPMPAHQQISQQRHTTSASSAAHVGQRSTCLLLSLCSFLFHFGIFPSKFRWLKIHSKYTTSNWHCEWATSRSPFLNVIYTKT